MESSSPAPVYYLDIFCRVVDNFGDIGVCWRLARILAEEHACRVRLVVDRPELVQRIAANPQFARKGSSGPGVELFRWSSNLVPLPETQAVIEAFACELPTEYSEIILKGHLSPLWINLEYLTAEKWIRTCHGLASRHPASGTVKYFHFPGFDSQTGGLLREARLLERRDAFRRDPRAQLELWQRLGVPAPRPGERRASLFGYENPQVPALLEQIARGRRRWTLLVPEGHSVAAVARWFHADSSGVGARWQRGSLRAQVVPFTDQDCYDRLLWACDLNLVRGEDSLVRALWAGRPLLWQLYRQDPAAVQAKSRAFSARLAEIVPDGGFGDLFGCAQDAWNDDRGEAAWWSGWDSRLGGLERAFERISRELATLPELAAGLLEFVRNKL